MVRVEQAFLQGWGGVGFHTDFCMVETEQGFTQTHVWFGWNRAGLQRVAWYLKAMLLPSALKVADEM